MRDASPAASRDDRVPGAWPRRLHRWLTRPQRQLDDGRAELFSVLNYTLVFALLAYLSFIPLFVALGVGWIGWFNLLAVLGFAGSLALVRRFQLFPATVLNTVIVFGHAGLATLVLGWDGGFHFPIIITLEINMLFGFVGLGKRLLLATITIATYLGLWFTAAARPPQVRLEPSVIDAVALLNVCVFLLVTTGVALYHAYTVRLSSRSREESLALLESQNALLRSREEELALARDRAEESSRAKSMFLANMSHELRTPLNAIIGYSDLILEEASEDGDELPFGADIDRIRDAGQHLLGLIDGILDLSKIEAGKMELELIPIDWQVFLGGLIATAEPLARKSNNRLTVKADDELGPFCSDPTKVKQIALNLLSNACKFTKDGEVTLRLTREVVSERPGLRLQIEDTGIGMKPEILEQIFEEFSQADGSTTREFGGTGLGLAITRRFCEMLGGRITVASEPEVGSTFTVWLPSLPALD